MRCNAAFPTYYNKVLCQFEILLIWKIIDIYFIYQERYSNEQFKHIGKKKTQLELEGLPQRNSIPV